MKDKINAVLQRLRSALHPLKTTFATAVEETPVAVDDIKVEEIDNADSVPVTELMDTEMEASPATKEEE